MVQNKRQLMFLIHFLQGDSGGPVQNLETLNNLPAMFQYGIVSYGPHDECGKAPAVYTNVQSFSKWILDNAN